MADTATSSAAQSASGAGMPFDAITKTLVETRPFDWVQALHLSGDGASIVDADLSTVTTEADRVIYVSGARPYLLHIEFQASRDKELPYRVLSYYGLLLKRYKLPVRSLIVLLRKEANDAALTGTLMSPKPGGSDPDEPGVDFRYDVLRVWEMSVDELLNGPLALVPFASVAAAGADAADNAVKGIEERVTRDAGDQQANELREATAILLGLRYAPRTVRRLIRHFGMMKENSYYKLIRAEVIEEGRAEGRATQAREMLLLMGQERFGAPDPATARAIEKISDPKELERLVPRLLRVNGWSELLSPGSVQ